ncbi:MAG: hypothetical protein EAZ55_07060 [Cytophagales bacterium]|nr:MAG: hypothetical protein EAZ55_07060 [Cytophagales bacterium]
MNFARQWLLSEYKAGWEWWEQLFGSMHQWKRKEWQWLGAVLWVWGSVGIFFIIYFPYLYDEIFGYYYIVRRGVLVSAFYYPGPNNHILYHVLCATFLHYFSFLSVYGAIFLMRFLSLFFVFLSALFVFIALRLRTRFVVALWGMLFLLSSPHVMLYSWQGRGYGLLLFLSIIFFFSLKNYRVGSSIVIVLGMTCVPTFLYWWVSGWLWEWCHDGKLRKFWLKHIFAFLGVLIVYLPVYWLNGDRLLHNGWLQVYPLAEQWALLPLYYWESSQNIANEYVGGWILGFVFVYILWHHSERGLYFIFIAIPFLMLLWQGFLPPNRIWIAWGFLFVWGFATCMVYEKRFFYLLCIVLLLNFLSGYEGHLRFARQNPDRWHFLETMTQKIPSKAIVGILEDTYQMYWLYYRLRFQPTTQVVLMPTEIEMRRCDWLLCTKKQWKQLSKEAYWEVVFQNEEVLLIKRPQR